ncbi:hypothetical protein [Campylobacter pinnipediorum]|uniref:hypothetical protein n=1 Tax=Campylobacter pinnipediorum TaxID=1965231 RepID=UPI00084DC209|nr:hypothetical protein [Campylobacter pinnipediorum]
MISMYELKLGNETLEALKFLLSQVDELETAITNINLEEVKSISATIQSNKNAIESAKAEIWRIKTALNDDKLDFDSKYVIFKEFSATIEPLKTLLNSIKKDVEQNAEQVATNTKLSTQNKEEIKQKYNEIQELARDVKADYEKSKENLTNSNFVKDEVIQKDNELREFVETKNNEIIAYTDKKKEDFNQYMEDKNEELEAWIEQKFGNVDTTKQEIISAKEQVRSDKEKTHAFKEQVEQKAKELISLESALSTLKEQIQETIKTGSINDDTLSSTQSYSSNKVEQDFLKKETAEQTYLKKTDKINAYTKSESDDKFVEKTKLNQLSINDSEASADKTYSSNKIVELLNNKADTSSIIDAYTKNQSDDKYAKKTELGTKLNVSTYNSEKSSFITQSSADGRYIRSGNANYTRVTDSLTSTSSSDALSAGQGKVLKGLIDKLTSTVNNKADTSRSYTKSESDNNYIKKSDATDSPSSNKIAKYNSNSNLKAYQFQMTKGSDSGMNSSSYIPYMNSDGLIFKSGIPNFLKAINVYNKTESDNRYLNKIGQVALAQKEQYTMNIGLQYGNNFVINPTTSGTLQLNNGVAGQSGTIIVTNGALISGFGSMCKFKEVPTELTGVEVFAYYVKSPSDIRMGRVN